MAAKEKKITKKSVDNFSPLKALATALVEAIGLMKKLSENISERKDKLRLLCQQVFLEDLAEGRVYGNHVFKTKNGKLTANFRVRSDASITQYRKSLSKDLGSHYNELFEEKDEITLVPGGKRFKREIKEHPELFKLELKRGITMADLLRVYHEFPNLFDIKVDSLERYAQVYDRGVIIDTKVYPRNGLLEKLGRIEDKLRKRALTVLSRWLEENLEVAIKGE